MSDQNNKCTTRKHYGVKLFTYVRFQQDASSGFLHHSTAGVWDREFCCGAVLGTVACTATSLTPLHEMPGAPSPHPQL